MKILLHYAICGLCNSLNALAYAIYYAKLYNRKLCVVWKEYAWNRGNEDFERYFSLVDIETITLQEVQSLLDTHAVYPEELRNTIKSGVTIGYHTVTDLQTRYRNICCQPPTDRDPFGESIVVYTPGNPGESKTQYLVDHLRFKPELSEFFYKHYSQIAKPYIALHIRFSDNKTLIKDKLIYEFINASTSYNGAFVASDSIEVLNNIKSSLPRMYTVQDLSNVINGPLHYTSNEILASIGSSKHKMNMEAICDLFVLAMAQAFVGDVCTRPHCSSFVLLCLELRRVECKRITGDANR